MGEIAPARRVKCQCVVKRLFQICTLSRRNIVNVKIWFSPEGAGSGDCSASGNLESINRNIRCLRVSLCHTVSPFLTGARLVASDLFRAPGAQIGLFLEHFNMTASLAGAEAQFQLIADAYRV